MKKDIRYVPTPPNIVEGMLDLARLEPADVLFDLGCGDGRLVIGAALRGARGVGVDIDRRLVARSQDNAREAGVTDDVEFRVGNFHDCSLAGATIVTLYLRGPVNERLLPRLLRDLEPGTRLLSHNFEMGDWEPVETVELDAHFLYRWAVP